jgi:hypothetical protein
MRMVRILATLEPMDEFKKFTASFDTPTIRPNALSENNKTTRSKYESMSAKVPLLHPGGLIPCYFSIPAERPNLAL